jgi:hypothetical protein
VLPLAVKLAATLGLIAVIVVACVATPPRRCPAGLVTVLMLVAVAGCVTGFLTAPEGSPLLALAVVASAAAMWLLRAPPDDRGDDGGEPPPEPPDPDAPDPDAFDWDEFERACRTPGAVRPAVPPADPAPR